MMLEIALEADAEWDSSTDWEVLVRRAAEAAIAESAFPQLAASPRQIELSVLLSGDEKVRELNARWRGKDKPTNVLSFPLAGPEEFETTSGEDLELLLGDIVLAHGVCAREAADKSVPVDRHAAHLIVHGTLHLLGYGHYADREAADMESREIKALARLGIADPYQAAD